ncbi:RNA polymerase sigma factor SigJ [Brachybacterium fresconis]|uniref:RNA polymerase sigma-70 factor (ECF subfamily) n=1 Tax=Brachybacterium fresconis TaxID=173363 RepID=A0ABS4YJZ9_9MICO|nr:RNA polymerase sigma factor SigJ [Brachybacterium fresconis]MBP2409127.1 RNA polymerase sigma-70 factor (ECF subfamily) [Brachybacterium fresconis]
MTTTHEAAFESHRRALLGAAYRVLGTVQDSEDAVQETWLRWQDVDLASVREPRAFLLTAVTRTALNTVRTRSRLREEYVGPWLPEPVSTDADADPGRAAEIADDVSLALLVVLESLSPLERAAFVLHEVFAAPYAEIAETLERSEAAVRQLVRRARAHVRERTPRHPVDESTHRALTEAFLEAVRGTAALEDMISVLSPDVVLTTDGGGHAKAARRPVRGTDNVLRFAAGVLAKPEIVILSWQVADINGRPALVGHDGPRVDCVVWVEGETAGAETMVTRIDMIRNPGKLRAVRV